MCELSSEKCKQTKFSYGSGAMALLLLHIRTASLRAGSASQSSSRLLSSSSSLWNGQRGPWDDSHKLTTGKVGKKHAPLFKPVQVLPNYDDVNIGQELAGAISKHALMSKLKVFYKCSNVKKLAKEHGLDDYLFNQAFISFRKFCMNTKHLPADIYVTFADILAGTKNYSDIFPYFLSHARKVFPHLECLDELRKISDLTDPPNWYPEARAINRKIIFHSGPTNSGKTHHALERLMSSQSGVYCGPLKLLAMEVFNKCNARGTPCDLVTGEERRQVLPDGSPAAHLSCTVEMVNVNQIYEVAVIDEIQMIQDQQRGWAWTRAFLGIPAHELHVCGEAAAIDLIREMCLFTFEDIEVRRYQRLTVLNILDQEVGSLSNIQPGDCIVCFNKQDIYSVSRGLERIGVECAVIYGSLPPGTKLAMADRFNDPNDSCKVMVATDAIGMGLNLNIRRIVFYSLSRLRITEDGEREMDLISVSQALQIAGRAGRFGTQWDKGYVTCFKKEDIAIMKELLSKQPDELLRAGLHPTFDQLELYSYHLPKASLSNLVDIFLSLSVLDDSLYSLCQLDEFKFVADLIQYIKLPLKAKYTFCCAPINRRMAFECAIYHKICYQFSKGELVTFDWLCHQVNWPLAAPKTIMDLMHLEEVYDIFDIYLWLSYRFPDMFPDVELVRSVKNELDKVIEEGVVNIVQLLRNSKSSAGVSGGSGQDLASDQDQRKWSPRLHKNQVGPSTPREYHVPRSGQDAKNFMKEMMAQGLLSKKMMAEFKSGTHSEDS